MALVPERSLTKVTKAPPAPKGLNLAAVGELRPATVLGAPEA